MARAPSSAALLADTALPPRRKAGAGARAPASAPVSPFEYAFLLDALKDEQSQGITIDVARVFFKTAKRDYVIIDAPGHNEFLKNMVTGAARAQAALLVIDANEGDLRELATPRDMLSMLGIQQLAVLVNKMDLVGWSEPKFRRDRKPSTASFSEKLGLKPACFVPAVGREGDFIANTIGRRRWYDGPTVLDAIDAFHPCEAQDARPFRMPVQDVYKFTGQGRRSAHRGRHGRERHARRR